MSSHVMDEMRRDIIEEDNTQATFIINMCADRICKFIYKRKYRYLRRQHLPLTFIKSSR